MEAKGCAKPTVWKNARRHFYWAVRSRVARSSKLGALADATPDASFAYRSQLLDSLAGIEDPTDYRGTAEVLEKLDLSSTLSKLKADHLLRELIYLTKEDRKATIDGLARLADNFSDEERAALVGVLQSAVRSPAPPSYTNTPA